MGTGGRKLTCPTTLSVTSGWHPLLTVLAFMLCDLGPATVKTVFVNALRALDLNGANSDSSR